MKKLNRLFPLTISLFLATQVHGKTDDSNRDTKLPGNLIESYDPDTAERLLNRTVGQNGISAIHYNHLLNENNLSTKYNLEGGAVGDQKSSGRCWIFSGEKILSEAVRDKWGKDFTFSRNYIAFWDKLERANYILEKLYEYRSLGQSEQKIQNLLKLTGDGGEWELFKNTVKKYGLVPDYAMQETTFSGRTSGYNDMINKIVRHSAGLISQLEEGHSEQDFADLKEKTLLIIRDILISYLGTPPQFYENHPGQFYWKNPKENKEESAIKISSLETDEGLEQQVELESHEENYLQLMTPIELLELTAVDLDDYVHIAHLPYHRHENGNAKKGWNIEVENINNMMEGEQLKALLMDMNEIKASIRRSIMDKCGVEIGCEMTHLDRDKSLLSVSHDLMPKIFKTDTLENLDKGSRLVCGEDVIAHGMYLLGCDDQDKCLIKNGKPGIDCPESFGPLWKVQNSWGNSNSFIYMTDYWFTEYAHSFVIKKKYLSPEMLEALEKDQVQIVPSTDPFGQVTLD